MRQVVEATIEAQPAAADRGVGSLAAWPSAWPGRQPTPGPTAVFSYYPNAEVDGLAITI